MEEKAIRPGAAYQEVVRRIDEILERKDGPVLAAIDGMCGSGKTTMGRALQEHYGCNLFHMDDFFLRPEQRSPQRYEEPGGNVDYERFREEVLTPLLAPGRQPFCYQVFDCSRMALGRLVKAEPRRLNLIEGAYSQHPFFGDVYDLKFFCQVSKEEQIRRIRLRNGEEMLKRFKDQWIPLEERYFAAFGIREKSILVDMDFI